MPVPLEQEQGKGMRMVELAATEEEEGVERGRLLAPRREGREGRLKRDWREERVVAFGGM